MIFHDLAIFGGDSYRTQTCNLLIRSQMLYSIELRSQYVTGTGPGVVLFGGDFLDGTLGFADAGLLAGEVAEVEDTRPADLTDLVDLDLLDERALVRENPLDTDAVGNLTDGECPGIRSGTANLDDYSAEILKSVLITFFDPVGNGDGVTGLELRIGGRLVLREGILHQFNQIHILFQINLQRHRTVRREAARIGLQMYELFLD